MSGKKCKRKRRRRLGPGVPRAACPPVLLLGKKKVDMGMIGRGAGEKCWKRATGRGCWKKTLAD